ncbi:MAG: hypothetical protein HFE49_07445 [Clostridia bacterium]|nr:hypothetical protein [Clostridia bacterium]
MKKSVITKILALTLALSACAGSMSIYAQEEAETAAVVDTDIQPRYTGITSTSVYLKNLGSGNLNCQGSTVVRNGYNAGVTVELQKNNNGTWNTIKTWSDSGDGVAAIEVNYYAGSGTYRLKATHRSYTSGWALVESVTKYSNIV